MRQLKQLIFWILFLTFTAIFFNGEEVQAATKNIVNPNQVYSYNEMVRDIKKLEKAYPDLVKVTIIGKSEYGRNLYSVSLGKGPAEVFINGSHHAREWMTTNLNMYMIDQYAQSYQRNQRINGFSTRSILNATTIVFVPMVNPDGVTLQQQGLKAFPKSAHKALIKMNDGSKNFKRWKANGKGIDLNRQYNANWSTIEGPKSPSYKNFKGYGPATAKETKAILAFVQAHDFEMSVSYHSSGQILFWNFKQPSARYKRDYNYAKAIGNMTGYRLIFSGKNPSGGGFTDWFIQTKKRPAFTPEISRYYAETNPPLSEFPGAWRENKAVGLYVARESAKLYDSRKAKETEQLKKELKSLVTKATKLKSSYAVSTGKVTSSFVNVKKSITTDRNKLYKKAKALPVTYQNKISSYFKTIDTHLKHSTNFINGVQAGEVLLKEYSALESQFINATLHAQTLETATSLGSKIIKTESIIAAMYNASASKQKYITPVKNGLINMQFELDRYELTLAMEAQLAANKIAEVEANLVTLEKLEVDSKAWKLAKNMKTYAKTEALLLEKKTTIVNQLAALALEGEN